MACKTYALIKNVITFYIYKHHHNINYKRLTTYELNV